MYAGVDIDDEDASVTLSPQHAGRDAVAAHQQPDANGDPNAPSQRKSTAQRIQMRFYTHEFQRYHTVSMYEELLLFAQRPGVDMVVAYRSVAGFDPFSGRGRERVLEPRADPTIIVELLVSEVQEQQLLELIAVKKLPAVYTRQWVEYHEVFRA